MRDVAIVYQYNIALRLLASLLSFFLLHLFIYLCILKNDSKVMAPLHSVQKPAPLHWRYKPYFLEGQSRQRICCSVVVMVEGQWLVE